MKEVRIPPHACLHCQGNLDGATNVTSSQGPKDGDLTICIYCGHLMAFTADLALRELNAEEQAWCEGSPVVRASQEAVKANKYTHPDKRVLQ